MNAIFAILFSFSANASAAAGLSQCVFYQDTEIKEMSGGAAKTTATGFLSKDNLRLETSIKTPDKQVLSDQIINLEREQVIRIFHDYKTYSSVPLREKADTPQILYRELPRASSWNNLTGRAAQITLQRSELVNGQLCLAYAIEADFSLKNFKTRQVSEGKITGKAWKCDPDTQPAAAVVSRYFTRYKTAIGTSLSPQEELMLGLSDVSVRWEIKKQDLDRIAADIAGVLAITKGYLARTEFTWSLPAPSAQGLKPIRMSEVGNGINSRFFMAPKTDVPPPGRADAEPRLSITTSFTFAKGNTGLDKSLFSPPAGYQDNSK